MREKLLHVSREVHLLNREPDKFLMHHGTENMKWGVRNGPPYPLPRRNIPADQWKEKSATEKKDAMQRYGSDSKYGVRTSYKEFSSSNGTVNVEGNNKEKTSYNNNRNNNQNNNQNNNNRNNNQNNNQNNNNQNNKKTSIDDVMKSGSNLSNTVKEIDERKRKIEEKNEKTRSDNKKVYEATKMMSGMSNDEIRAVIERMKLETDYMNTLNAKNSAYAKGKEYTESKMEKISNLIALGTSAATLIYTVQKFSNEKKRNEE